MPIPVGSPGRCRTSSARRSTVLFVDDVRRSVLLRASSAARLELRTAAGLTPTPITGLIGSV